MNKVNIRFTNKVLSLVVAGGIMLTPLTGLADKKPKEGTFIEYSIENEEGIHYNQYVVRQGDTTSRVSEKICRFFGEEKSTEFWPAIAFLNGYPRIMRPGDIIIFPETYEELVLLNNNLRSIGWTARYIQGNGIYRKRKEMQYTSIRELLLDIYGTDACIDEDFVYRYLDAIGVAGKYDAGSGNFTPNELFELTDWIPSLNDLGYEEQEKTNSK